MTVRVDADGLPAPVVPHPRMKERAPLVRDLEQLDALVLEAWVDAGDDERARAYAMGLSVAAATIGRPVKVWASPERQREVNERARRRRISLRTGRADALADFAGYLRKLATRTPPIGQPGGWLEDAANHADRLAQGWNTAVKVQRSTGGETRE